MGEISLNKSAALGERSLDPVPCTPPIDNATNQAALPVSPMTAGTTQVDESDAAALPSELTLLELSDWEITTEVAIAAPPTPVLGLSDGLVAVWHGTPLLGKAEIPQFLLNPPNPPAVKWYYVVSIGKVPGVYTSWPHAGPNVIGVPCAIHQRYKTKEEAIRVFKEAIANNRVFRTV